MHAFKKQSWLWLLASFSLLAGSCGNATQQPEYGLLKANTVTFLKQEFDIVHFKPGKVRLGLFWKNHETGLPYQNFEALKTHLKSQHQDLLFATNAGIFSNDFTPGGLHVERGKMISPLNVNEGAGNFHMMPNGVFYLNAEGAGIAETNEYVFDSGSTHLATQSGPMLVIHDKIHPSFTEGSSNKFVRSGVGVSEAGEVYFAISLYPVNFYDFARLFKEKLNCPDALYLDGTISKFFAPALGRDDVQGEFVGILGAIAEPAAGAEAAN